MEEEKGKKKQQRLGYRGKVTGAQENGVTAERGDGGKDGGRH